MTDSQIRSVCIAVTWSRTDPTWLRLHQFYFHIMATAQDGSACTWHFLKGGSLSVKIKAVIQEEKNDIS